MSVGMLIKTQAAHHIRYGADVDVWSVSVDPELFDVEQVKHDFLSQRSHWRDPVLTESGIYVLVERFLKGSRCYKLDAVRVGTELSRGVIEYPATPGAYGILSMPAERFGYDIREHIRHVRFAGETAYDSFKESRSAGMATLKLSGAVTLEGKLLDVPDDVRLNVP